MGVLTDVGTLTVVCAECLAAVGLDGEEGAEAMIYIPKVCECCGQQLVQVNTYPTSGTVTVFYHRDAEGELTNQCPKFAAMHEAHLNLRSGA